MKSVRDINIKIQDTLNRTKDYVGLNLFTSLLLTTLLEILLRRSLVEGILFIKNNSLLYLLNLWIIFTSFNISLIFTKKNILYRIILSFWLVMGIINFIIMSVRRTPLSFMDAYEISSDIVHKGYMPYLTLVVILIILFGIFIKIKLKKINQVTKKNTSNEFNTRNTVQGDLIPLRAVTRKGPLYGTVVFCITCAVLVCIYNTARTSHALSNDFGNLRNAYMSYGFTYCFSNSVVSHGISKPNNYNKESMNQLEDKMDSLLDPELKSLSQDTPNIVMVQLESFFDVNTLKGIEFNENPIPNFTQLKQEYSSGFLSVPSFGAGTANTEFEVITSMNLEHFAVGEYPYRTILQFNTVESAPYVLDEFDYTSYAIHNNNASFYKRNTVFSRLGFDYFIPLEAMENVEYNPTGWAKDMVLIEEIDKSLRNSVGSDFIYTISVQPHNEYPTSEMLDMRIQVNREESNTKVSEEFLNQMEYFANQLYETDDFVGQLLETLSTYEEDTIVVFYGDHLPPMELDNLLTTDKYHTEYVIWDNFSNKKRKETNLETYQLIPYVLEEYKLSAGNTISYHQASDYGLDESNPLYEDYQRKLKHIQYDLLYGKSYLNDGKILYTQKQIKIGLE